MLFPEFLKEVPVIQRLLFEELLGVALMLPCPACT